MGRALSSLLLDKNRPTPAPPTHLVLIEILNRDLSVKRITVYFNPADKWDIDEYISYDPAVNIAKHIFDQAKFVNRDNSVLAWTAYLVDIPTQEVLHKFATAIRERVD